MVAAATSSSSSCRLFLLDSITKSFFLIDTGSAVSLIPRNMAHKLIHTDPTFMLMAANGTSITVFGSSNLTVILGMPKRFIWSFIVADVSHPIIGADFLKEFDLLVDLKRNRLIDGNTLVSSKGTIRVAKIHTVFVVHNDTRITSLLSLVPNIIKPPDYKKPPPHNTQHSIPTTGPAVHAKPRRIRPDLLKKVKKEVDEMVNQGLMRPSHSDWSSGVVIREKPDGSLRICGDYRNLNNKTTKDDYPMPHIADATAQLTGKTIFSNIDIIRAYYNIPLAKEDCKKTALSFPFGLYEHVTMPFGLTNAPRTWQRFMNNLFHDLDFVFVYLDDILIFSTSEDEHTEHLKTVLSRLDRNGLRIHLTKCQFFQNEIIFLGHKITKDGLSPTEQKITTVENLQYPQTISELRGQLGLLNFYRPFMKNAAANLAPLNDLLKGHTKRRDKTKIIWTEELRQAHRLAKSSLVNYLKLAYPRPNAQLRLTTDASDIAVGGVLEQKNDDHQYEPLGFFSVKLTEPQQAWSVYDKELYAIATGIEKFEHLLEGRNFTVRTDHKPLTFLKPTTGKKRTLERRNRVIEYILQFNPTIEYIRGSSNVVADSLSRLHAEAITNAPPLITLSDIAAAQITDTEIQSLLQSGFRNHNIQRVTVAGTELVCSTSESGQRPIVPENLRRKVFDSFHTMSHPGRRASVRLILKHFWWPTADSDIRRWCRTCIACQKSKILRHTHAPLQKFPPSNKFEHVHIDLVGPLPNINGFRYLCTFIDRWTRWPEAIPLTGIKAEEISTAFIREWVARHGIPLYLTCDRGTQFTSELFSEITKLLGTKIIHTTAYHPPANGALERWHRTLKSSLTCTEGNWLDTLPLVLLALRNTPRTDTNVSASQLTFGHEVKLPNLFFSDQPIEATPATTAYVSQLKKAIETIRPQPFHWKRKEKPFVHEALTSCSHVFIRVDRTKPPLAPAYEGPYKVLTKQAKFFEVDLGNHSTTISIDRLKPAFLPSTDIPPVSTQEIENGTLPLKNAFEDLPHSQALEDNPLPTPSQAETNTKTPMDNQPYVTRYGRVIQPPTRFIADMGHKKKTVTFDLHPKIRKIAPRQNQPFCCHCSGQPANRNTGSDH